VTIVQHDNNTKESEELIRQIVLQLYQQGIPVSEIFSEEQGRGKEEEIVEDLETNIQKRIREYHIQFEHNNILQELLNIDVEEFSF